MDENGGWRELLRLSLAVPDARGDRGKRHKLSETLFLVVSAMLADSQDALDIVDFGNDHRDWLEQFLELEHGIPSHDTILRVLAMVKPEAVEELVRSWTRALAVPGALTTDGFQVAFDGKSSRGSANRAAGESPVHIVSAYLTESGFTLGSERVDDKSNEITAVPKLMRSLGLQGATVTGDALLCQREIAGVARECGAHYLLQVKGNQPTLQADVKAIAADIARRRLPGEEAADVDRYREVDKGHGRIETRVCYVSRDLSGVTGRDQWVDLSGVAVLLREREDVISGKSSREMSYFILSDPSATARQVAEQIRAHWSIENGLHWSLDVVWGEDAHRVVHRRAAENTARLRRFAAGLIQQSVGWGLSGRRLRKKCSRNPDTILQVLAGRTVSRERRRALNRKDVGRFGQGGRKRRESGGK